MLIKNIELYVSDERLELLDLEQRHYIERIMPHSGIKDIRYGFINRKYNPLKVTIRYTMNYEDLDNEVKEVLNKIDKTLIKMVGVKNVSKE